MDTQPNGWLKIVSVIIRMKFDVEFLNLDTVFEEITSQVKLCVYVFNFFFVFGKIDIVLTITILYSIDRNALGRVKLFIDDDKTDLFENM